MRTLTRLLAALSVVLLGWMATPAHAQYAPELNVVGREAGTTLLLPFFEVNLAKADGMTTVFTIGNTSATAVLAHVNVMSDLGVLALGFNVYLTGYDIQTINLRDIINGVLPRTASAGQDPTDTISNKGDLSQDINFASCNGQLPPPALPANYLTHIKNSLTGKGTTFYGGNCVGLSYGDNVARGYVTVDTVNNCTLADPNSASYYAFDTTPQQNVLWGDAYFLDTRNKVARAAPIVPLSGNYTDPLVNTPGNYTFYGRYVGWNAGDRVQSLATRFATRYQKSGAFGRSSSLIVWRDPKVGGAPFTCGTAPGFVPLGQEEIVAFDDQENPTVIGGTPFGAMAQRVVVGSAALPVPANSGWFYLNLNTTVAAAGANPPVDPLAAQAWVGSVLEGVGANGYSIGLTAAALDSATDTSESHEPLVSP